MIIAIDFDGTIAKWALFPDIGEPVPLAIETIKELQTEYRAGVVLYTVRCSEALEKACEWLEGHGIELHGVNVRPGQTEYSLSPKIDAELFIDDKAFGCPLISMPGERPYVDWQKVRDAFGLGRAHG